MGKCALINGECPRTSDTKAKRFCPAWEENGVVWVNQQTGEQKVVNCSFSVLMKSITEQIRVADGVQAAVESHRNEVVSGLEGLGGAFQAIAQVKAIGNGRS